LTKLENIASDLSKLAADIRAEVLLALAMQKGLLQKEFTVQPDGFFYRSYVNDLYRINYKDRDTYQQYLALHLSRPGLYDALPEGLFFEPGQSGRTVKTAGEMAEESRINKKKENEIRRFFAPFENELFLQTLKNEMAETNLLQGLRSGWLKEYFIDFWKLPHNIPATAALVLVMFLPYVHRIAGDIAATSAVLQKIINEPVTIELKYASYTAASSTWNILGSYTLGSQLTCGKSFIEQYPVAAVTIGPLQKTKAYQYVEGGNYFALLQTFYNYFIPANAEVVTTVLLKSNAEKLVLKTNKDAPILGISSVI
jgi:hypothetical protein